MAEKGMGNRMATKSKAKKPAPKKAASAKKAVPAKRASAKPKKKGLLARLFSR